MNYKILFTTDFSENSRTALVYALKLYEKEKCDFYFLHAININTAMRSKYSSEIIRNKQTDAKKKLVDLKVFVEKNYGNSNHKFSIILSVNDLTKATENAIKAHGISLIIMGAKGVTGAKEFFVGSNTMRLINSVENCPVLVVPENHDFIVPNKISFLTDYHRVHNNKEIEPLKQLANLHDSKIEIVHIHKNKALSLKQENNQNILKSYLIDNAHSLHWIPKFDNETEKINEFIEETRIDIIVLVNYKLSFIERIIKEPIIKKIGYKPIIPFLVIPEKVN